MDNKIKILIVALVVAFAGVVVWAVGTAPDPPPPIERIEPPKVMEYEGNTITEEKNGVKLWELVSEKSTVNIETQMLEFEKIQGKFYKEDGKILELHANYGNYNQKTKDVHVEGDILLLDGEGGQLTCETIDWLNASEIIVADNNVKISKDDMRAFADRAEVKSGFRHFSLKGNARVLKGVKSDKEIIPDADIWNTEALKIKSGG